MSAIRKRPKPAFEECKSCWYLVHGNHQPFHIKVVCSVTYTISKIAEVCPCLNCIMKIMCRKPCEERKRLVLSSY